MPSASVSTTTMVKAGRLEQCAKRVAEIAAKVHDRVFHEGLRCQRRFRSRADADSIASSGWRRARPVVPSSVHEQHRLEYGPAEAGPYRRKFDETGTERIGYDDEARWTAVLEHDRAADGRFVYAVSSTGIYCRPSCPSRRPRRDRVAFFDAPADARVAGYRACKRCKPDAADAAPIRGSRKSGAPACISRTSKGHRRWPRSRRAWAAARITCSATSSGSSASRRANTPTPVRLRQGEGRLRAGRRHHRRDARRRLRIEQPLLRARGAEARGWRLRSIAAAAPACRSATRSSTRRTRRSAGCSSRRPRAACARWRWDSSDRELTRALSHEYPAASIAADAGALAQWTSAILEHLAGRAPRLDLPLDVQATAFQWQVWQALASIPYGETRTYSEVAAVDRQTARGPRRRPRLRHQSRGARDPVSPRRARSRRPGRLSLGRRAERGPVKAGSQEVGIAERKGWKGGRAMTAVAETIADRVDAVEWAGVDGSLDAQGFAPLPVILEPSECDLLAGLYAQDARFRSRIDMSRFRFGVGDRQYFAAPLPALVQSLRETLYARLAPIANRWTDRLRRESEVRNTKSEFPPGLDAFLARCHASGQTRPTPLLLSYSGRRLQLPASGYLRRSRVSTAGRVRLEPSWPRLSGR